MFRKLFTAAGVAVGAVGIALLPLVPAAAQTGGLAGDIASQLGPGRSVYNDPYSDFVDESNLITVVDGTNIKVVVVKQDAMGGVSAGSFASEIRSLLGSDVTVIVANPDVQGSKDAFDVSPSTGRDEILSALNTANTKSGGDLTASVQVGVEKIEQLSSPGSSNGGDASFALLGLGGVAAVLIVGAIGVTLSVRKARAAKREVTTITAAEVERLSGYRVQPVPTGFVGSAAEKWRELQNRLAIVSKQDLEAEASYEVDRVKKDLSDLVRLVDSYNDLKEAPSEVELTEALVALDDELKDIIDGKKAALNGQLASFRDWLKARKKDAGLRL